MSGVKRTYKERLEYQVQKLSTMMNELDASSARQREARGLIRQARALLDEELEEHDEMLREKAGANGSNDHRSQQNL